MGKKAARASKAKKSSKDVAAVAVAKKADKAALLSSIAEDDIIPPFPSAEPPNSVRRGGREELVWLQAQHAEAQKLYLQLGSHLSRVQQELMAIRSSLVAQGGGPVTPRAHSSHDGDAEAEERDDGARGVLARASSATALGIQRGVAVGMCAVRGSGSAAGLSPKPGHLVGKTELVRQGDRGDLKAPAAGGRGVDRSQRKRAIREGHEEALATDTTVHVHPKSEEVSRRILATLARKAPFAGHEEIYLAQLVGAMAPYEVGAGVAVITEGEQGDLVYWVEEGELSVHVGDKEVDTIVMDSVFGEAALVYDLPRNATIRANCACKMWLLHRAMFQHMLRDRYISERKQRFAFLKTVKIFNSLSGREISRIADVVESVSFEAEAAMITEGEDADAMYVIQDGQAVVSQALEMPDGDDDDGDAAKSLLRILKPGDYFGERALLEDQKRSASVTAASKVSVLRIDKATFRDLLGGLRDLLVKLAPTDRRWSSMSLSRSSRAGEPATPATPSPAGKQGTGGASDFRLADSPVGAASAPPPRLARTGPLAADLVPSKSLGSGGYGRVSLVRHTKTKRVYALKRVTKAHLLARNGANRCENVTREKRVLEELEHPFVCTLHSTYADSDSIYLLLGAAMGGDLYRLMDKLEQMSERVARFYAAALVLALAHIHAHEIVYRDLKPENVLLDSQGYVKLCDFGFAKHVADRTYTMCGTPDYTSPEMVLNQGVNSACDWWALGVLVFEMLIGVPPFNDPDYDDMKIYHNITHSKLSSCYPRDSTVTNTARTLIQGLCTVKVAYRLGHLKGGAQDVMAHPWFEGYDWDGLVNLTEEPPWRPALKSFDDTACFGEPPKGVSLDGPTVPKAHSEELQERWQILMEEYAGVAGLQSMRHLV